MIQLTGATAVISLITSSAADTEVHASLAGLSGTTVTPGSQNPAIASATTTTVVGATGSGTIYRRVKTLQIRNKHASTAQDVTVQHNNGTTTVQLIKVTLAGGEELHYDEGAG